MKKVNFILLMIFLAYSKQTIAQNLRDVSGKNIYAKSYSTDLTGSTFFINEWAKGTIKFKDNFLSKQLELKYDLLDDILIYKDEKNTLLQVDEPINEFRLIDKVNNEFIFRAGFNPSSNYSSKSFFQVLYDGNIKLLKKTIKSIVEEKEYNSGGTSKRLDSNSFYFICKANTPILISKNQKDIFSKIGEMNAELTEFAKLNKLDYKKEIDLIKLIQYFDTIKVNN